MVRPVRVLLIEDNLDDVVHAKRVLKSCGLLEDLTVIRDGKKAVDYLAQSAKGPLEHRPDLIVLDLGLPKVSGLEVLQWIRADQLLREIPVVILTGSREDSALIELHRLGVLAYLVKPLTSRDLVRTVAGCVVPASA